jgi:4-cresol dehydrogenase (hydroxylating)
MKLMESGVWPADLGHAGGGHVVPLVGSDVRTVMERIKSCFHENGINFVGGFYVMNQRTACVISGITFNLRDTEQVEKAYVVAKQVIRDVAELGYGDYRAHVDYMDEAQSVLSWNDGAYRRFAETIKDAIDPNGILSPGRHGIWPAKYRQ